MNTTILEQKGSITFNGSPLTLIGKLPLIGELIPNAQVTDQNLNNVNISSLKGKSAIILSVPSLDTEVCSREARYFNERIDEFEGKIQLFTISMDLPFAQKRWCASEDIKNLQLFSDYREASFGKNFGVLIKELHLLARAVFIVDKNAVLRHLSLVKEVTEEPNYEKILKEAKKIL